MTKIKFVLIFFWVLLSAYTELYAQTADLEITQTAKRTGNTSGTPTTFIMIVENNGPDAATNVVVENNLNTSWSFNTPASNYSVSHGSISWSGTANRNIEWEIPYIPNGGIVVLTFNATVNYNNWDGAFNNSITATITASDATDSTPGNNSSTISSDIVYNNHNLSVEKTADPLDPAVGDPVEFTIEVDKVGGGGYDAIQITDKLPPGYTYVSHTASNGNANYTPSTGVWNLGSSYGFTTRTLTITATVDAPTGDPDEYKNVAFVSTACANSDISENIAILEVAPEIPTEVDLEIEKTVNDSEPEVDDDVTFTITVTNNGPDNASEVTVTDMLPSGYDYVSSSASIGSYNDATGEWYIGDLDDEDDETLIITVTVLASGTYVNTASVTSDDDETNPSNNTDSASTTPDVPSADLAITKDISNTTPSALDNVVFTIEVENLGPENATGVTVTDMLPSGYDYVNSNATTGSYNDATGEWSIGNLNNTETETLEITATVQYSGNYTNSASVTHDGADVVGGNNTDTAAPISVDVGSVDLEIEKVLSHHQNSGQNSFFAISVRNSGPDAATNVVVQDNLTNAWNFTAQEYEVSHGTVTATGTQSRNVEWEIPYIPSGGVAILVFQAVNNYNDWDWPGAKENMASITAVDQDDSNPANDSDTATSVLFYSNWVFDMGVTKSVSPTNPYIGQQVEFTIEADKNNTDGNISTLQVIDKLPPGYTYLSHVVTRGTYNATTGVWAIGNQAWSGTETLTITVLVNAPTGAPDEYKNVAAIFSPGAFSDTDVDDNLATATIPTPVADPDATDLSITKTVDDDEPDVLDNVTFTLAIENLGPTGTTGVVVEDLLPSGYSYVSSTASTGTYNNTTGEWTVGSFADEATATLTITAQVLATGSYTNTATISGDDTDSVLGNNTDSASVTPYFPEADLEVSKSISNATPDVGQNVTFTLTATNNGPDDAGTVLVDDVLPTGYEYVSSTPSVGAYDEETGEWTIGTLANETIATLQIIAEVLPSGAYENIATISGAVIDDTSGNDTDSADITNAVDIAITKSVDEPEPDILTNVIFTIEVENLSTNDATGVVVTDVIPSGYNYVSNTGGASYNATTKTVTWSVGDLDASDTDSFTITAEVKAGGNHTNTATVAATEPDETPGNNSDSASVTPDLGNAVDLQVTQEVDDEEPNISATVTFTITAENNGPNPATGVVSNIRIASGLQYVSATASAGTSYNSGTGVWTIGAMASLDTATLEIDATVLSGDGAAYLTIAEITGNEAAYDSDVINNTAYAILTPNGQTFLECDVNAENPVFRETFGTGAPMFSGELAEGRTNLEYHESPPNMEDGQYTIAKNAQNGASNWQSITDASGTPNGYFMIVNADLEPHEFFRIRIDLEEEFCSNTQYTVNFSAINVNSEENYDYCTNNEGGLILPEIGYFIQNNNGEILGAGTSGEIPYSATAQWQDYNFIFTTSVSDEYVDLVIFNKAPGGCGNDLAIDDITMYACMTPPIRLDMAIESDQLEVCGGETVTMDVIYTPDPEEGYVWPPTAWSPNPEDVEYQWQRSDDQITWTDIPGETEDTYIIEDFQEEDQAYYRLLYAQEGNIDKASCRFPSEDLFPVFNATPVLGDIEADVDEEELCVGEGPFQLTSAYDTSSYVIWDEEEEEWVDTWGPDFYDWESSNNSVATVDEDTGMLTPVAAGSVTITYTVISPKGECEGFTEQTFIIRNEECEEVTPSRLITNPMIRSRVISD